ncbi:MAG: ABC-F family ATP-binding cassette domain-containing protein [Bdellovibrionales bacterium]
MAAPKAVLGIENGEFYYGLKRVFEGVSFQLDDARTGLVGENGAGKTTMLKCLTGELELTHGQVVKSRGLRVSYLPQDIPEELQPLTVRRVLEKSLAKIGSDEDWKIDVLLHELNVTPEQAGRELRTFSGGWQRLLLIAAATSLEDPGILILDEPTNHLDFMHLNKLEDWLLNQTKAPMLIVSHDRAFLEKVTTRTLFLRRDGAHIFKTAFSNARSELLQRDAAAAAVAAQEEKELERLKKMANQYKAWGVLNSNFHKKMKTTEKRIERIQDNRTDNYVKRDRQLALNDEAVDAKTALRVEDYTVTAPDGRVLYKVDRLAVKPGDRIVILGPNGVGKTMFLNALAASYEPSRTFYDVTGPIRFSPAVNMVYFDQRMKLLPVNTSIRDYIEDGDVSNRTRTNALLAKAGFDYDRAEAKIGSLSYGEQSRLCFLRMKLLRPNFYLLDEPTNHLDIEGQEDLEEQLANVEVSCVFVSHDRYFVRAAATRFFEVKKIRGESRLVEVDNPDDFFASQELVED